MEGTQPYQHRLLSMVIMVRKVTVETHLTYEGENLCLTRKVGTSLLLLSLTQTLSDPFDNPRPIKQHTRTMSAPATIQFMRQKSATAYRSYPGGGPPPGRMGSGRRRVKSALPVTTGLPMTTPTVLNPIRELAKEPCIQEY